MSLETRVIALAQAIGVDIKTLTAAATNVSARIDDVQAEALATNTALRDEIIASALAVKAEILGGAPEALNTLKELADALAGDPTIAATLTASLANRVRVDALQSFTSEQKTVGRQNIGAASDADLAGLSLAIGNTDTDFVAAYTLAKA